MNSKQSLLHLIFIYIIIQQVNSENDHSVTKRQVSVLARDGHLPYEGKRYVGLIDYDQQTWTKPSYDDRESNEATDGIHKKRYVGALAKSGDLRFKQRDDKRDELDTLIEELLTAEELKRIRLEALREELYNEKTDEDIVTGKRSLSSLARNGNFPFGGNQKRVFGDNMVMSLDSPYSKRGISSIARNGQLPTYGGKRGGISSMMRNRYLYNKRYDEDFDEDYSIDNKRSLASLARNYNLPGKRNIASIAEYRKNMLGKKSVFDNWIDLDDDNNKINEFPNSYDKRNLGSFLAQNKVPFTRGTEDYEVKRNLAAMARNWNLPNYRNDKRYHEEVGGYMQGDEAASLLNQNLLTDESKSPLFDEQDNEGDGNRFTYTNHDEEKSFAMRKKKSVNLEEQSLKEKNIPRSTPGDENKTRNDVDRIQRSKREAFDDNDLTSDEYSLPVLQHSDSEYDYLDQPPPRFKRFAVAVKGGGKIPRGRLPGIGSPRRNSDRNSGRRRH